MAEIKIGSIVIDCINFDKMVAFWQEALHYLPWGPADPPGRWISLRDASGKSPSLAFQYDPEKLTGRNWLHFDLKTNDQKGEVERLLKLGATRNLQEYRGDEDFVVLVDPDGNLFCVVDSNR